MRTDLQKAVAIALCCLFLVGCAGRTAVPVAQHQYGDDKKPCDHLKVEIAELQGDITVKTKKAENTKGANVALGVTGMILFWPALFFMDLSEADQIELEAMRKRHNALVRICVDQNCGYEYKELPPFQQAQAETGSQNEYKPGGGAPIGSN
jgi:hypothetical protein